VIEAGQILRWLRTFTRGDVERFTVVSGDAGRQHRVADAQGRLMVQGLLTASLPTKLGGDIDYIARDMVFEFLLPVWSGDTVQCEMRIVEAIHEGRRVRVLLQGACTNQHGQEVLRFRSNGFVRMPKEET
jgi:acyl dehydratase